jgi:glyoxylase I family protein
MNLSKVHHVAILGSDYETSKKFYIDTLGFTLVRENYREERGDWKIDLEMGDMELELFIIPNCPKRVTNPEAYGLRHLCFHVEDVEQTVRELAEKGVVCEPLRMDTYTNKPFTFFSDPDGLPLELHG